MKKKKKIYAKLFFPKKEYFFRNKKLKTCQKLNSERTVSTRVSKSNPATQFISKYC